MRKRSSKLQGASGVRNEFSLTHYPASTMICTERNRSLERLSNPRSHRHNQCDGARSINTQFLEKCHILSYIYTFPLSEFAWKQLCDKDIYTCQWKYLISGMMLHCPFCVLKCLLNLKFYDSDEIMTRPENKKHTWLRSQQSLEPTASACGSCRHLSTAHLTSS